MGIRCAGATAMVIENKLSGFLNHWRSRHPAVEVQLIEWERIVASAA
jgi:hypothetical protein